MDFNELVIELESYYVSLKGEDFSSSGVICLNRELDEKLYSSKPNHKIFLSTLLNDRLDGVNLRKPFPDELSSVSQSSLNITTVARQSFIDDTYARCGIVEETAIESSDEGSASGDKTDNWSGFVPRPFVKEDEIKPRKTNVENEYDLANYFDPFRKQCFQECSEERVKTYEFETPTTVKVQKKGRVLHVSGRTPTPKFPVVVEPKDVVVLKPPKIPVVEGSKTTLVDVPEKPSFEAVEMPEFVEPNIENTKIAVVKEAKFSVIERPTYTTVTKPRVAIVEVVNPPAEITNSPVVKTKFPIEKNIVEEVKTLVGKTMIPEEIVKLTVEELKFPIIEEIVERIETIVESQVEVFETITTKDFEEKEERMSLTSSQNSYSTPMFSLRKKLFISDRNDADYDLVTGKSDRDFRDKSDLLNETMQDLLSKLDSMELIQEAHDVHRADQTDTGKKGKPLPRQPGCKRNLISDLIGPVRDDSKIWSLDQLMAQKIAMELKCRKQERSPSLEKYQRLGDTPDPRKKRRSLKKRSSKKRRKRNCGKTNAQTLTPLSRLRAYEIKRNQNLNHHQQGFGEKDNWMDSTFLRVCKDEQNNWTNTPLFHPFWYECMYLHQRREEEKQQKGFMEFKGFGSSSVLDSGGSQSSVCDEKKSKERTRTLSYYSDADDMISIFKYFCSMNGTLPKDHSNALKKFLLDMRNKKFDEIKLATYRAAAKLFFVQKTSYIHLVDIYNIIEAFRENGLNTLEPSDEIDEPRLECIIASIFYALYKRLPAKTDIDVEKCILILTQWIMHAYDSEGVGRIRVLSVKTALSTLCEGRLVDKFRYVFTQISEKNGILNVAKLDHYLRDLLMLPSAIGEEPNFGYSEDILDSFFKPIGSLNRNHTKLDDFLDVFMNEKTSGVLFWLHMLNKISKSAASEHQTQCKGCGQKNFTGLRYKCQECYSYNTCQDCYWRDRVTGTHKADHTSREYSTWNKNERGSSVKTKLLCSPSKSQHQKLPDYPKEPEPNKTLDMSNIVPPLPSEPSSPMSTLSRTPRSPRTMNGGNFSQFSTLTRSRKTSSGPSTDGPPSPMATLARNDDEHSLILMYAQKLASVQGESEVTRSKSKSSISSEPSSQQKEILTSLEEKNRKLLNEIRILKQEHEEAVKNTQQISCDPNLLTELRVLRQRKDELEMRMSALQETRRELMVQLEGLMKLLKNNQMSTPRQVTRASSNAVHDSSSDFRSPKSSGTSSTLMRGVNGDVKEAFGKSSVKDGNESQDLRVDLMNAVDDVTCAMANVVSELAKTRGENDSAEENNNSRSSGEEQDNTWGVDVQLDSSIKIKTSNVVTTKTELSVY